MHNSLKTTCCIVGGGPAGMMLGLLLARAGVEVLVLEKHADFFRDFRGDTIHPSTLEIIYELGLLPDLLKHPHDVAYGLNGFIEDQPIKIADFSKLKVHCPYIAFMPQWDFLDFLSQAAKIYPNFTLKMQYEVTDLLFNQNKVVGVSAKTPDGIVNIHSTLVVGCDGRHSIVRAKAGLKVQDIGAPMDVFWFRLSRKNSDPKETFGKFAAGKIMVVINRNDYWQCGYVIPKGYAEVLQREGIVLFRQKIAVGLPFLADRVAELNSWDDIKLLTVKIDRLKQWYCVGLLCIGDAAHAMSPIGGVGINLAIQDAVACANIIAKPLLDNSLNDSDLYAVQKRRTFPTKVIQKIQVVMQNRVIKNVLVNAEPLQMPWLMRQLRRLPIMQRMIGRLIGIGVRPEHVDLLFKE